MNYLVSNSCGEFRGWVSSSQDTLPKTSKCAFLEDAIESIRKMLSSTEL